jgi:dsDNA-specific endonuclease/ATPase MutS2
MLIPDIVSQRSEEVAQLRSQVTALTEAKRALELDAIKQADICDRLSEANDKLSQRALLLAQDTEQEKKAIQAKLEREIAELQAQLQANEGDLEDMQSRYAAGHLHVKTNSPLKTLVWPFREQTQRIQLLDEVSIRRQAMPAAGLSP